MVVAFVVVMTAMSVVVSMMTFMRGCSDINDFNVTIRIFDVDRCEKVGSADER